jgi:nucleoside phosphorylase
MGLECDPLLKALSARLIEYPWAESFPFRFYTAALGNLELVVAVAGLDPTHGVDSIGSVPAAVLAGFAIRELKPDLVLNPGTCGGFISSEHKIGEVLIGSEYVAFHSRRITIPTMREYGLGKYPVTNSEALRQHFSLREGIVSSGDALDYSDEDKEYMLGHRGTLKEMEAAAIGWVCQFFKVPFLPIKAVTDFVDHPAPTADQFLANYGSACENLKKQTLQILDYLDTHPKDAAWGGPKKI